MAPSLRANLFIWLCVSAAVAHAECPAIPVERDIALAAQVDMLVDRAVVDGFAGQVAIIDRGVLVYSRAAGTADRAGRVAVRPTTLFDVASVTKYFTAVLALRAVEEGRIAIEASIGPLAPGTRLAERGTTWIELLSHRAGLGASYAAEGHDEPSAALDAIDNQPLSGLEPGAFKYSNDGFDVAAILLEKVYGSPFERVMHQQVLARACIDGTRLWTEADKTDPAVVAQPLEPFPSRLLFRNYGMLGSIGILTTAEELVRFEYALSRGSVIEPGSYQVLVEPRVAMSLGHAALGAFVIQNDRLGVMISARGAEDWGTNAILNHYRERDLIVAVVTSRGPGEGGAELFRDRIARGIESIF